MVPPASQVAVDLRASLTAVGAGPEVLGGIGLLGLNLPGLDLTIDAVLVLPRGILVVLGVDLPDPAMRLDAPIDGPWLVDGWRLVRPDGTPNPVAGVLAARAAVAARLEAPGAPGLPVLAVVAVGPYVRTVVQPPGDPERGLRVLVPSPRRLLRLATELSAGVPVCGVAAAAALLRTLAPSVVPTAVPALSTEGFTP